MLVLYNKLGEPSIVEVSFFQLMPPFVQQGERTTTPKKDSRPV